MHDVSFFKSDTDSFLLFSTGIYFFLTNFALSVVYAHLNINRNEI